MSFSACHSHTLIMILLELVSSMKYFHVPPVSPSPWSVVPLTVISGRTEDCYWQQLRQTYKYRSKSGWGDCYWEQTVISCIHVLICVVSLQIPSIYNEMTLDTSYNYQWHFREVLKKSYNSFSILTTNVSFLIRSLLYQWFCPALLSLQSPAEWSNLSFHWTVPATTILHSPLGLLSENHLK